MTFWLLMWLAAIAGSVLTMIPGYLCVAGGVVFAMFISKGWTGFEILWMQDGDLHFMAWGFVVGALIQMWLSFKTDTQGVYVAKPNGGGDPFFLRCSKFIARPFAKALVEHAQGTAVFQPSPLAMAQVDYSLPKYGCQAFMARKWMESAECRDLIRQLFKAGAWVGRPISSICALLASPLCLILGASIVEGCIIALVAKWKVTPLAAASQSTSQRSVVKRWFDSLASDGAERYAAKEAQLMAKQAPPVRQARRRRLQGFERRYNQSLAWKKWLRK